MVAAQRIILAALGSSFAAGPTIPRTSNYPNRLAEAIDAHLDDLAVSGATTEGVISSQISQIPSSASLVTITAAGNDVAYVTYIQHIAANAVDPDSTLAIRSAALNGRPIPAPSDADITTVANRLINVVTAVRDKARNATVVLVGYLTVVPPTPNSLSSSYFNETTYPALLNLQSALATIFSRAASQSNATYFDTVAYSADHGVGTGDPWVFGIRDDADGVDGSFHPNEAGMQAVADGLAQLPAVQNALKVQDTSARSSASTLRPGWASVKRWMRGAEP